MRPQGTSYKYDGSVLTNVAWSGSVSGTVGFEYDNDFRIRRLTVNGVNVANYTFDNDGLLTAAGSMTLRRNAQTGFLTNTVLASVSDRRAFGGFGELTNYAVTYAGSPLYSTAHSFDKLGRITNRIENIQGTPTVYGYSYDSMGRLVQVLTNGVVHAQYLYDLNGNRTSSVVGATSQTAVYDAQDRLLNQGGRTYLWDANGTLTNRTVAGQSTAFSYDSFGSLLAVALPDGRSIEYVIDGANRRVGKKVNGVFTRKFLYKDGLKPVAELDAGNNVVSHFIYGTRADIPDYMVRAGVTYRIVADHLGSPRLVVNASSGAIAQRMDFDEWGNVLLDTNPGFQPFGFAGGLYDSDTGLVRFGARDYDPETGRWTAKDPILFVGGDVNLYAYCGNNPVNFRDPFGLFENDGLRTSEYGTADYLGRRDIATTFMGTPAGTQLAQNLLANVGAGGIGKWEWGCWLGQRGEETIVGPIVTSKQRTKVSLGIEQFIALFGPGSGVTPAGHVHVHTLEVPPSPQDASKTLWENQKVLAANPNATDFYVVTPKGRVYQIVPGAGYYQLQSKAGRAR